jgi:twinkle protein
MARVPNKACPKCQETGHDKNGDHLYLMADGKTWCCQRTHHHADSQIYFENDDGTTRVSDKLGVKGESFTTPKIPGMKQKFVEPSTFPVQGFRGIPDHVYGNAGVHCEVDEFDEPVAYYYPLFTQEGDMLWKIRRLPKNFHLSEEIGDRKLMFFNQDKVGLPKRLLITEGQDDALAATHMLSKYRVPVVSVPNGANTKAFIDNYEWLSQIDELIFDPDSDEAGEKLVTKVAELFPRIKILRKQEKDACDMYKKKLGDEYVDNFFRAKVYQPSTICEITDDLITEATSPVEWGLSYPFPTLTEKTFGFVTPCVVGIGGGPGAGKTTFVQAIQSHLVYHHRLPVGIIDLENRPGFALRKLIGYQLGVKIHTPDTPYPPELQDKAKSIGADLRDRGVIFYDNNNELNWNDVLSAIRYMVVTRGIRAIFIDPMSGLVAHLSTSEGNEYLNKAMFSLSRLTRELDFGVFHVNHLNNPGTDKDHGEGARVRGSQFSGSRAMWKYSTDLWGLEANQQADSKEERNKVLLRIIKHRLDGNTGTIPLKYNEETGRHEELSIADIFKGPADSGLGGTGNRGASSDIFGTDSRGIVEPSTKAERVDQPNAVPGDITSDAGESSATLGGISGTTGGQAEEGRVSTPTSQTSRTQRSTGATPAIRAKARPERSAIPDPVGKTDKYL